MTVLLKVGLADTLLMFHHFRLIMKKVFYILLFLVSIFLEKYSSQDRF